MKVTNTQELQFLVLNTQESWEKGHINELEMSDEEHDNGIEISDDGLALKSENQLVEETIISAKELLNKIGAEIDFAVGDCDLLYLADAINKQIWIFDAIQRRLERVSKIQTSFTKPTNIAYSPSTIYIVDETSETQSKLYAFRRHSWKERWNKDIYSKVSDLVADRSGNVYVLLENGSNVIEWYNVAGNPVDSVPRGDLDHPTAIALQQDEQEKLSIYVLNEQRVIPFTVNDVTLDERTAIDNLSQLNQPTGLAVDRFGNIYVGEAESRNNLVDSRFIYRFTETKRNPIPMLGYRGAVKKLAIAPDGTRLYVLNNERNEVIVLRLEKQIQGRTLCNSLEQSDPEQAAQLTTDCAPPTPSSGNYCNPPQGIYYSTAFDSTQLQTRWHKLMLEGEIPNNTKIQVYYITSDQRNPIEAQIKKAAVLGIDMLNWSTPLINPQDALIIASPGRYLWLRIELIGTQQQSPTLKSLRVYFPRLSYLRYLPATYQEDESSRDFLERFLSLFETSLLSIEGQIERISRYFDPDSDGGVGEFLRWLATWLDIAAENDWSNAQLKQLVKAAPKLYQQRGTKEGLETLIKIFTGDRPIIIESFQETISQEVKQEQKKYFTQLCEDDPFCFCVLLTPCQGQSEEIVKRLIDTEKPAHTEAVLYTFQPSYYLDEQSYIGVNTYLASSDFPGLDRGASLSGNTFLLDEDEIELSRRS